MSAEVVPHNGSAAFVVQDFTSDQIETLKNTIAKDCTNSELSLFIAACRRTRLDPFAKQIYAMKMGGKLNVTVSIDGARIIAERSGEYEGQEGPFWCGPDGAWKDVWLDQKPPVAAKVLVFRKGCKPMVGTARFAAYSTGQNLWAKMPEVMIAKCAEMLALRKAFPNDLSGIYSVEEMEQAKEPEQAREEFKAKSAEIDSYMRQGSTPAIPPPKDPTAADLLAELQQIKTVEALTAWNKATSSARSKVKQVDEPGYKAVVSAVKSLGKTLKEGPEPPADVKLPGDVS